MTVPSKTWIRSRLPSTTLTDTRTVSPGAISGKIGAELLALELLDGVHRGGATSFSRRRRGRVLGLTCERDRAQRPRRRGVYRGAAERARRPQSSPSGRSRARRGSADRRRSAARRRGGRAAARAFVAAPRGGATGRPRRGGPRQEHGWDAEPAELLGAGVLRVLQQAIGERVARGRGLAGWRRAGGAPPRR